MQGGGGDEGARIMKLTDRIGPLTHTEHEV